MLTPLGVILRKDAQVDSRIHEMLSLHRPAHLTPTDTLSIGLNGLLVQGSCPVPLLGAASGSHSPVPDAARAEWVEVNLPAPQSSGSSVALQCKSSGKVQMAAVKFEISFDSKDTMNDWIDAIMDAREVLL